METNLVKKKKEKKDNSINTSSMVASAAVLGKHALSAQGVFDYHPATEFSSKNRIRIGT